MEIRAIVTNLMSAALAAIFSLSYWLQTTNAFHVFSFLPAIVAAQRPGHGYKVFLEIAGYLCGLEGVLDLGWSRQDRPEPPLWPYLFAIIAQRALPASAAMRRRIYNGPIFSS